MQNTGWRNPPVQDRGKTIPSHLCALTATDQDAPPQPANATLKDAQLSRVTRNSVVLVVAQHNLAQPCADLGRTMMLPALKLSLDGFELRDHSLLRRNPPDDESFVAAALPTEVGETQERFIPALSGLPTTQKLTCTSGTPYLIYFEENRTAS